MNIVKALAPNLLCVLETQGVGPSHHPKTDEAKSYHYPQLSFVVGVGEVQDWPACWPEAVW